MTHRPAAESFALVAERAPARVESLEPRRLLAAGELVGTFGNAGRATVDFDGRPWQRADEAVQLGDGSIVVLGQTGDLNVPFPAMRQRPWPTELRNFVAKLTPEGDLDAAFGSGGVAPVESLAWPDGVPIRDLQLLPDGDLIGEQRVGGGESPFHRLIRLNPDLTIDAAFGDNGILQIDRPAVSWATLPGGGLAVYSQEFDADGNTAGSPEARLQVYASNGRPQGAPADLDALLGDADLTISDVAADGAGRIVLAVGANDDFRPDPFNDIRPYAAAVRLTADLGLDTSFADNGFARRYFDTLDMFQANLVAVGGDGRVLLVTNQDDGEQTVSAFGADGDVLFERNPFRFGTPDRPAGGYTARNDVTQALVQPDGRPIVIGPYTLDPESDVFDDENLAFAAHRFAADGGDDTAFAGGQVVLAGADNLRLHRASLTPDGDLLLAGSYEAFAISTEGALTAYEQRAAVLRLDLGDIGNADEGDDDDDDDGDDEGDGGGDNGDGDDDGDGDGDDEGDEEGNGDGDNDGDGNGDEDGDGNGGGESGGGDDDDDDDDDGDGNDDDGDDAGGGDEGGGDAGDDTGTDELRPTATLEGDGLLRVLGTSADDLLLVALEDDDTVVVRANGVVIGTFARADVVDVEIEGFGGDDQLESALSAGDVDGFVTLRGGAGDDTLLSRSRYDRLFGDAGNDLLTAAGERGLLYGGEGDDTLIGGTGRDALWGGPGNDLLRGGDGGDFLDGGDGDDALFGEAGDDSLVGGSGSDALDGGDGTTDLVFYPEQDAPLTINLSTGEGGEAGEGDVIVNVENALGGDGDDAITGTDGANFLLGGLRGNDRLFGLGGDDTLVAGLGNTLLDGGAGDDVLIAYDLSPGDTVVGAAGDDLAFIDEDADAADGVERVTYSIEEFLTVVR